ncbi:hypothetical protein GCM10008066_12900 [Oxalicibacterium faecigallinarum]|uniref:Uncharacterized protein n=2 Tax=Oxalicibacterium faecigallinarum TaxID=573741 RepID=A0A8J3AQA2_9BURK|nr:hypothetical protein GCM10008066_12900 [Oxalicibacterium faecigallinarum]
MHTDAPSDACAAFLPKGRIMKISFPRLSSRLVLPLLAVTVLGGCAVVPYDDGYYSRPSYSSSVYVAPAPVYFGGTYYSRGYHRPAPRYAPPHHVHPRPRHHHPHPHPRPPGWRR